MCKNVNRHAANIGIYGDTGKIHLSYNVSLRFLKYWHRIANVTEEKLNLLYHAHGECKDDFHKSNKWASNVNSMLK